MLAMNQTKDASALQQKPFATSSCQRRRLYPNLITRRRVMTATRPAALIANRHPTDQLLDEEFDELNCELSTLLRIAIQQ